MCVCVCVKVSESERRGEGNYYNRKLGNEQIMDNTGKAMETSSNVKANLSNVVKRLKSRGPRLAGRRPIRVHANRGAASVRTGATATAAPPKSGGGRSGVDVIAGGAARAAAQATIHPLDTIKVRLQAPNAKPISDKARNLATQSLTSVARKAGSLYRGVWSAAGGAGLAIGAHFAFYGVAKSCLEEAFPGMSLGAAAFAAGAFGAAGASIVKVPAAVCIRSVQARVYPNAVAAAVRICKAAGPRGLYTGFLPTLLEDVPDTAVKFAIYEVLQSLVKKSGSKDSKRNQVCDALVGGLAGAAAAASTTPLDVIKTRMMVSASCRPSMMSACSEILAEQRGLAPFMSGMGPRAVSSFINSAVFFAFFECLRRSFAEKGFSPLSSIKRRRVMRPSGLKRRSAKSYALSQKACSNVHLDLADATSRS